MILSEIKVMDQKNRTHINQKYLEMIGIEPNSPVQISVDTDLNHIIINKIPIEVLGKLKRSGIKNGK